MLAGVVSALAGIYYTLRFGSARGDNATGLELRSSPRCCSAACRSSAARGRLHGVLAGVLLIGVISSALRLEGVTVNVINIIIGLLLVVSVMSTSVLAWVVERGLEPGVTNGASSPSASAGRRREQKEGNDHEVALEAGNRVRVARCSAAR